jgi:hypothetical protein
MVLDLDLSQARWEELIERALAAAAGEAEGAGGPDSIVAAMAQHLTAPVRATLLATAASSGVLLRCTLVEDRVLVIAQRIAEAGGRAALVDDARLTFTRPTELWPVLSDHLPPLNALTAAGTSVPERSSTAGTSLRDPLWADEQANLHVRVEAWRLGSERPDAVWLRFWSVVAEQLYDIRRRAGEMVGVPRPAGSVAAEFAWAVAGAVDAVAARIGETGGR